MNHCFKQLTDISGLLKTWIVPCQFLVIWRHLHCYQRIYKHTYIKLIFIFILFICSKILIHWLPWHEYLHLKYHTNTLIRISDLYIIVRTVYCMLSSVSWGGQKAKKEDMEEAKKKRWEILTREISPSRFFPSSTCFLVCPLIDPESLRNRLVYVLSHNPLFKGFWDGKCSSKSRRVYSSL